LFVSAPKESWFFFFSKRPSPYSSRESLRGMPESELLNVGASAMGDGKIYSSLTLLMQVLQLRQKSSWSSGMTTRAKPLFRESRGVDVLDFNTLPAGWTGEIHF
jgi:hypothetical protein